MEVPAIILPSNQISFFVSSDYHDIKVLEVYSL